jgi:hypothetical protein
VSEHDQQDLITYLKLLATIKAGFSVEARQVTDGFTVWITAPGVTIIGEGATARDAIEHGLRVLEEGES